MPPLTETQKTEVEIRMSELVTHFEKILIFARNLLKKERAIMCEIYVIEKRKGAEFGEHVPPWQIG